MDITPDPFVAQFNLTIAGATGACTYWNTAWSNIPFFSFLGGSYTYQKVFAGAGPGGIDLRVTVQKHASGLANISGQRFTAGIWKTSWTFQCDLTNAAWQPLVAFDTDCGSVLGYGTPTVARV